VSGCVTELLSSLDRVEKRGSSRGRREGKGEGTGKQRGSECQERRKEGEKVRRMWFEDGGGFRCVSSLLTFY